MYDYIKGEITSLTPTEVVVETCGVGYLALISLQTYAALDGRKDALVFVHHVVREDDEQLYGFATRDERELFRLLISVSGVGAATARMMLSSLTCDEIRGAILSEDVRKIQSVKGIGSKSAGRVIVDLKDKISKGEGTDSGMMFAQQNNAVVEEATTALIMLGFNKAAVSKVLAAIVKNDPAAPVESLIKQALQKL